MKKIKIAQVHAQIKMQVIIKIISEQITEQTTENCQIMTIYKNCIKNLGITVTGYFCKFKKE